MIIFLKDLFDDYVTPRQAENRKSLLSDEG